MARLARSCTLRSETRQGSGAGLSPNRAAAMSQLAVMLGDRVKLREKHLHKTAGKLDLDTKQAVKHVTLPFAVLSMVCLIVVMILNAIGVFG